MFSFVPPVRLTHSLSRSLNAPLPAAVSPTAAPRPYVAPARISLIQAPTATVKPRRMPPVIRPVVPSGPLRLAIQVEDCAQSRGDILKALSRYVKTHKLQDPSNKRSILCDSTLAKLLGVDTCTFLEMSQHVNPHLRDPAELGGRYIEEARLTEEEYFKKRDEARSSKPTSAKPKKKRAQKKITQFKPLILSEELAAVCNAKELTRPQVIKAVWAYICEKKLKNGVGQPIRCDPALKKVFNADEISTTTIMGGISPHLTKKE